MTAWCSNKNWPWSYILTEQNSMMFFHSALSVESFSIGVTGPSHVCHGQYNHVFTGYAVWRCVHSLTLQNSQHKQKDTTCIISSVTHTTASGFLFTRPGTTGSTQDVTTVCRGEKKKKLQFPLSISRTGNKKRQLKWVNRVMESFTFCLVCEFLSFCSAFKQKQLLC